MSFKILNPFKLNGLITSRMTINSTLLTSTTFAANIHTLNAKFLFFTSKKNDNLLMIKSILTQTGATAAVCKKSNIIQLKARSLITSKNSKFRPINNNNSSNNKTQSSNESSESQLNELTVSNSKKVMRLIYARVHPDLYTNHLQAQVYLYLF